MTEIYNFVLILVFPGPSRRGNHNSWKQLKCRRKTRQRPQKPMLTTMVTVLIALLWKIFMDWLFGSEYARLWVQPETKKIAWLLSSTIRKQVFSSTASPYLLSSPSPPQAHRSLSNVLRASLHRTSSLYYSMQCEQDLMLLLGFQGELCTTDKFKAEICLSGKSQMIEMPGINTNVFTMSFLA